MRIKHKYIIENKCLWCAQQRIFGIFARLDDDDDDAKDNGWCGECGGDMNQTLQHKDYNIFRIFCKQEIFIKKNILAITYLSDIFYMK